MQFQKKHIRIRDRQFHLSYAREFPAADLPCFWASLWPSSLALAEHVLAGENLKDTQVLEIGCGCGLAGIAAGIQGGEVTVTDLEQDALKLAEENWKLNDLTPTAVKLMDWRKPETDSCYDLIVGADVLYNPKDFPDLIRSLKRLLKFGGSLVISEPGRPHARNFFARMLQAGFQIDTTHYPVVLHKNNYEISVSEIC